MIYYLNKGGGQDGLIYSKRNLRYTILPINIGEKFKQCFNDVLGFRLRFEDYPKEYPDYFRVVDLRRGKKIDDGYRAIHLYYQRDNLAYPIEIQLWCGNDIYLICGVIDMFISIKMLR